jgi:hypothetical protein
LGHSGRMKRLHRLVERGFRRLSAACLDHFGKKAGSVRRSM